MDLAYFHLIDRITDLDLDAKTIVVEAQVPTHSTIFEGHFPGYPLMPGVLLIEAMAQTSGWLLIALMKFERMPFLGAVKEAKMRVFVTPGELKRLLEGAGLNPLKTQGVAFDPLGWDWRLSDDTDVNYMIVAGR